MPIAVGVNRQSAHRDTGGTKMREQERRSITADFNGRKSFQWVLILMAVLFPLCCAVETPLHAADHVLFGDLKVKTGDVKNADTTVYDLILYSITGNVIGRDRVQNGGRYRFFGLSRGEFNLAIEVNGIEVARINLLINTTDTNYRKDIELEWKPTMHGTGQATGKAVSAADAYQRSEANQSLFEKAEKAIDEKKQGEAIKLLRQLLKDDPKDYQAWSELGTTYLMQSKWGDAEKAYSRAIEERPTFGLALLNLGRVLAAQKKFDQAIEPLSRAVELEPDSADANLLLGEAYLQIRKGSKAVGYLNQAAELGRPEAHLRLAALYDAAGMKDRAAAEYEKFLAKEPDYKDKKKLQDYVTANKK